MKFEISKKSGAYVKDEDGVYAGFRTDGRPTAYIDFADIDELMAFIDVHSKTGAKIGLQLGKAFKHEPFIEIDDEARTRVMPT